MLPLRDLWFQGHEGAFSKTKASVFGFASGLTALQTLSPANPTIQGLQGCDDSLNGRPCAAAPARISLVAHPARGLQLCCAPCADRAGTADARDGLSSFMHRPLPVQVRSLGGAVPWARRVVLSLLCAQCLKLSVPVPARPPPVHAAAYDKAPAVPGGARQREAVKEVLGGVPCTLDRGLMRAHVCWCCWI